MNDKELQEALSQWNVEAQLPPDFQRAVWRRIARQQQPRFSIPAGWFERVDDWFRRPMAVAGYAAAVLLVGVSLGYARGQNQIEQQHSQLSQSYLQSVDPYQNLNRRQ